MGCSGQGGGVLDRVVRCSGQGGEVFWTGW